MKYLYILEVTDEDTGKSVAIVEAYTQESLIEQLRKVDGAIKKHEEKHAEEEI